MTPTAELVLPNDVQPETVPTEPLDALATQTPAIEPRMAQLLELNQANGPSLMPKRRLWL